GDNTAEPILSREWTMGPSHQKMVSAACTRGCIVSLIAEDLGSNLGDGPAGRSSVRLGGPTHRGGTVADGVIVVGPHVLGARPSVPGATLRRIDNRRGSGCGGSANKCSYQKSRGAQAANESLHGRLLSHGGNSEIFRL